jgi:hypothetical protein
MIILIDIVTALSGMYSEKTTIFKHIIFAQKNNINKYLKYGFICDDNLPKRFQSS